MSGIGSHSPAKNIIGKNRIAPMASAASAFGATAAMNRPVAISAAAASSAGHDEPDRLARGRDAVADPGHGQDHDHRDHGDGQLDRELGGQHPDRPRRSGLQPAQDPCSR